MFPGGGPAVDFFRAEADRQGGRVLELGCGTGHKLIPIASDGHPCVGLDSSSDMLAEAQRKAKSRGVAVQWTKGDMRAFDLGGTFDFVFITANSLLHLHEAGDLVSCFQSVRRHLAPGARFVFDVFNPSVRLLAEADGVRRTRESLSFIDPDRGDVQRRCRRDLRCVCASYPRDVVPLDCLGARLRRRTPCNQEHLPAGAATARLARRPAARRAVRRLVRSSHLLGTRLFNSASASPRDCRAVKPRDTAVRGAVVWLECRIASWEFASAPRCMHVKRLCPSLSSVRPALTRPS